MANFNVQQAKKQLSVLIERASNGEKIVITQLGKPVAQLLAIAKQDVSLRIPGIDKGKVVIKIVFDDPLHEFDG